MSKLLEVAQEVFNDEEKVSVHYTNNEEYNKFLNDIDNYPHAYVLACLMDKQILSERAWEIPCKIYEELGNFDIDYLAQISEKEYIELFVKNKYHRFNETEAKNFYKAVQRIKNQYNGDASKIWKGSPSSATVVYRFLEFEGIGIKIATMATNILARQYKVKYSDYYSVDISPDIHVKRVLTRLGYLNENSKNVQIIYKAREINPEFPGLIDCACWKVGRTYCHATEPDCINCPLNRECEFFNNKK